MADDSHGAIRRSGRVIGRSEHAAAHGRHAQHLEEAPAHMGTVHKCALPPARHIESLVGPREGAVEQIVLTSLDLRPNRVGPRSIEEQRQTARVAHRQRAQDEAVKDREQRGIGADAQRQSRDRDERENRVLAQATNRDSDVLPQLIDGARDPHVAHVLDGKRHVAYGPLARPRRGVGREAVTLERVLTMSAVRLYLVTKIGVVTRATEEVHQAAKERAHEKDLSCPMAGRTHVDASTRWITLTMRSNSACSAVSCLRPAAVSV